MKNGKIDLINILKYVIIKLYAIDIFRKMWYNYINENS